MIETLLKNCSEGEPVSEVDFELFVRTVALLLEQNMGKEEEAEEEFEEDPREESETFEEIDDPNPKFTTKLTP